MDFSRLGVARLGVDAAGRGRKLHRSQYMAGSRGTYGKLILSPEGTPTIKFLTKRGGAYNSNAALLRVAIKRMAETPDYRCRFYYNGTNIGGVMNASGSLQALVTLINANTTNSLNTHILAVLLQESSHAYHAAASLAKSVPFVQK